MSDSAQCSFCGKDLTGKKATMLYGATSCKGHAVQLAVLRAIAFLIDVGVLYAIVFIASFLFLPLLPIGLIGQVSQAMTLVYIVLFLTKDAYWGRSAGKFVCGLVVIDAVTKENIGTSSSLKRNIPLLIPFAPLVAAFQIGGTRIGDKWAKTRVLQKGHAFKIRRMPVQLESPNLAKVRL